MLSRTMRHLGLACLILCAGSGLAEEKQPRTPLEALKPFNKLVGAWKGTGVPERGAKNQDFWVEHLTWEWQFKKDDAWLVVGFNRGKHYTKGELRYLPETDRYRLTLQTVDKKPAVFEGTLEKNFLTLEREASDETEKLVITLLHETRFLYHFEVKPKDKGKLSFRRQYRVGATRKGVAFAAGDGKPECIVSGGLGTSKISYKGKDYYVCCSGCRDAFNEDPEKFIKAYEAKKKAK